MTLICLCGYAYEHPVLEPFPRFCARCGACWRCGNHRCTCLAAVLPWIIYEALRHGTTHATHIERIINARNAEDSRHLCARVYD